MTRDAVDFRKESIYRRINTKLSSLDGIVVVKVHNNNEIHATIISIKTFNNIFYFSSRDDEDYISLLKAQEPSALEIAAEQMRLWPTLPSGKLESRIHSMIILTICVTNPTAHWPLIVFPHLADNKKDN